MIHEPDQRLHQFLITVIVNSKLNFYNSRTCYRLHCHVWPKILNCHYIASVSKETQKEGEWEAWQNAPRLIQNNLETGAEVHEEYLVSYKCWLGLECASYELLPSLCWPVQCPALGHFDSALLHAQKPQSMPNEIQSHNNSSEVHKLVARIVLQKNGWSHESQNQNQQEKGYGKHKSSLLFHAESRWPFATVPALKSGRRNCIQHRHAVTMVTNESVATTPMWLCHLSAAPAWLLYLHPCHCLFLNPQLCTTTRSVACHSGSGLDALQKLVASTAHISFPSWRVTKGCKFIAAGARNYIVIGLLGYVNVVAANVTSLLSRRKTICGFIRRGWWAIAGWSTRVDWRVIPTRTMSQERSCFHACHFKLRMRDLVPLVRRPHAS